MTKLALLRFARLIVSQLGSISSLRLIPTIHSFSSLRVQRNAHGALANPDLSQAMAPSKQKRTHAVFRVPSAHRSASTSKPRFVGERVKLGDVLQVVNGKNQKAVKDENGQYPIYGSGGQMGWASSYICPADTVIIGRKGNINKPIYVSEPFWNVDTAFGLVAKPELLDARYLYHFCKHYDFGKLNTTCTIPSLTRKNIEGILLRLPSLGGQKETAAQLDSILKQIALVQQEIAGLDSLVKSRFVEMFGDPAQNNFHWRMAPLGENAKLINGRAYKQNELLASGKYPVLRVGNFFSNRDWYYSDLELDEKKYCNNGDLLYAWSASFGPKIWDGGKVIYHYHIWKVEVGDAYNKHFLCKLLKYAERSFLGDTHGIGMLHLTKAGMEEAPFIVPPLDLQDRFAAFASQVDKSGFATHCDHLRASY